MTKRKAYHLKAGNLKNLHLIEETLPDPKPHEITVEVKAIGLNFADIFAMWGLYSATPEGDFVPGLEYSGVVLKTGEDVQNLKVGDPIMGVTRFGAYTTHLNIDHRYVVALPPSWDFDSGAAYLVQGLTAYYGLVHLGNLQAKQTVLIHSAAGGVGLLANRIAKKYEAYTIGTIGSDKKIEILQKEAYDGIIVRSEHFARDLKKQLGDRELNLVMECIGGKIFKASYEQLAPQGRMVVYGSARYATTASRPNYLKLFYQFLTRPKIDPQKLIELNKAILGFNLIWLYEKAELMHQVLHEMNLLQLPPPLVGHRFPFEELPQAIQLFQSGQTVGKVVIC